MSIWKFGDYQAYTSANVRADVKPEATVKNGYVGKFNPATMQFEQFDTAAEALGDVWIVGNLIDTPETLNTGDFEVTTEDFARIFKLNDVVGKRIEVEGNICDTAFASVSVGDYLIPETGNYQVTLKAAETGAYSVALLVKAKTTMGNFVIDNAATGGYICEVVSITFA